MSSAIIEKARATSYQALEAYAHDQSEEQILATGTNLLNEAITTPNLTPFEVRMVKTALDAVQLYSTIPNV